MLRLRLRLPTSCALWVAFLVSSTRWCLQGGAGLQLCKGSERPVRSVPLQGTVVASVVLRPVKGWEGCFGMMCTVVHGVCIHHRCGALGVGVLWLLWLAGFYRTRCHGCCLASVLCSPTLRLPVARRRSTGRGLSFPRRFPGTDGQTDGGFHPSRNCWRWALGRVEVSQGALKPGKVLGSLHDLCWFCRVQTREMRYPMGGE